MTFERVLSFVDGTPDGLEALRQAAVLRDPGGEILGVVALDRGLAAEAGFEARHAASLLEDEAREIREAALTELDGLPSAAVEVVVGRPAQVLLGVAVRRAADLIAIGRRGSSGRRGLILGNLVTELIHRAPCPVLVTRASPDGRPWVPRVVTVGVDGSDCSLRALSVARSVADRFGTSVRVVAATGGKPIDRNDVREQGDVRFDERRPVDALVAASESSDLLVVGCRGLHGLATLGSVSERVAHRSTCSVLVVCGQVSGHEEDRTG